MPARLADGLRLRDALRVCDTPRKSGSPASAVAELSVVFAVVALHKNSPTTVLIILFLGKNAIEFTGRRSRRLSAYFFRLRLLDDGRPQI